MVATKAAMKAAQRAVSMDDERAEKMVVMTEFSRADLLDDAMAD